MVRGSARPSSGWFTRLRVYALRPAPVDAGNKGQIPANRILATILVNLASGHERTQADIKSPPSWEGREGQGVSEIVTGRECITPRRIWRRFLSPVSQTMIARGFYTFMIPEPAYRSSMPKLNSTISTYRGFSCMRPDASGSTTGTFLAPGTCPASNSGTVRTSRSC
jgi:hypothetical protein